MINKNHPDVSIRRQSELLSINRSSLYYKKEAKTEEFTLMNMIAELYSKYPIYGYRRIHAVLKQQGIIANRKKIQRLMKLMNLYAIYPKPNTSKKSSLNLVYPYLLSDISITRPNQVWQVDITYLRTNQGFMYLVSLIDVYSRKIMGWRLSNSLSTEASILALEDAIFKYGLPKIVNSDQGTQFTSEKWTKLLKSSNIKISMTGKGRCSDNIYIERLWRSLKYEGTYLYKWNTVSDLKENIPIWVKWYNCERPHQSLQYRTPDQCYRNARIINCNVKSAANWLRESLFADFTQFYVH